MTRRLLASLFLAGGLALSSCSDPQASNGDDAGEDKVDFANPDPGPPPDGGPTDASQVSTADARQLVGSDGDIPQGEELNPGWIGGACSNADECDYDGKICATSGFPGGMCTMACVSTCPDRSEPLDTVTRCISANGQPRCASSCDFGKSPTGCRPDYTCVLRQRYGQPSKIYAVCLPSTDQVWPGESPPVSDVGSACSTDSGCNYLSCLGLTNGYCTKTMCDFAGCPAGSDCFIVNGVDTPVCLKTCNGDGDCRTGEGYGCDSGDAVCWPTGPAPDPAWDPTVGAADCVYGLSHLHACSADHRPYVVVHKSKRNLALCDQYGQVIDNFRVGLGVDSYGNYVPGDKEWEGDRKTPEGTFYVAGHNAQSTYYKAYIVSYPDEEDAERGLTTSDLSRRITQGEHDAIVAAQADCALAPTLPQTTHLGGWIEIHGNGSAYDWTWGCVALEDSDIDALWLYLGDRDSIVILP